MHFTCRKLTNDAAIVSLGAAILLALIPGAAANAASANFFVAPNGNDSWSGTLAAPNATRTDGPFASVAKAQAALRTVIQTHPEKPLNVMLRGGTYYLPLSPAQPGTLHFATSDSGAPGMPVTWENYPGETPIISGGEPVGSGGLGLTWTHVSGNLWQVHLPARTQPFEYLFYNGERRLRARLQSASGVGYYMKGGTCISTQTGQAVDISNCNLGSFLRIAAEIPPGDTGCPHIAKGNLSKCIDRFQYNAADPVTSFVNLSATYTGDPSHPCQANPANSFPAGDIELNLFESWTVEMMRVGCVDTGNHIIYFTGPTRTRGSNVYNFFGPTTGHRYIVENAQNAFKAAESAGQSGLWFLDRSASPWTLNYLANPGENPDKDTVVIAQVQPVSTTGGSLLSAIGINYVTFRGLTFEVDNYLPPLTGFNDDENGENTLPAAVDCESCQHVVFDAVTVRHTSSSGLQIASAAGNSGPPASNDVIQNSAFYDIGDSGIHIGHHPLGSDKASNVVQSVLVQNNIVQGYSRVFANGEGLAQGNGHDITYLHNEINDGYHAGISICVIGCPGENGSNVISQYNHIWNIIQGITNDGGTLYYNTNRGTGNKIYSNVMHDVTDSSIIDPRSVRASGYGGHGIYLDIQTNGVDARYNVVYRVSDSAIFVNEGPVNGKPPNNFVNNIVAYARRSMFGQQSPWGSGGCPANPTLRANITSNIFYFDRDASSGFHVTLGCAHSCGVSYDKFLNFQGNLYWRKDGSFANDGKAFHVVKKAPTGVCGNPGNFDAAWTFLSFAQWQSSTSFGTAPAMNEDTTGTASVDPKFGNTGQPGDYLLSSNPVPGFDYTKTNDTIRKAGRSNPLIKPPLVPATFPAYSYKDY